MTYPPPGGPAYPPGPAQFPLGRPPQPSPSGRSTTFWLAVIAGVLAVVVAVATVFVVTRGSDTVARYESADFSTPHPFTEPVLVAGGSAASELPTAVADQVWAPTGACDPSALKAALAADSGAAAAWAQIVGIGVDEIDDYIDGLTSATLLVPLQVTNHDYESGKARELQSVLEAGTAVLVDAQGVPRVRCACGNPLKPAKAKADKVTGAPAGFDLATVRQSTADPGAEQARLVDAAEYRNDRSGYTWVTAERTVFCESYEDGLPTCYLAKLEPPFTTAHDCGIYPGTSPSYSSVLFIAGPAGTPCHSALQGSPGSRGTDGYWQTTGGYNGAVYQTLPTDSAIEIDTADGPVRCENTGGTFGCRLQPFGQGYRISATEAVFTG